MVVLVALIGALTGGLQPIEDEQEPPNTPVSTNPEQKEDDAPKYYVVGDSVETDNFVITADERIMDIYVASQRRKILQRLEAERTSKG